MSRDALEVAAWTVIAVMVLVRRSSSVERLVTRLGAMPRGHERDLAVRGAVSSGTTWVLAVVSSLMLYGGVVGVVLGRPEAWVRFPVAALFALACRQDVRIRARVLETLQPAPRTRHESRWHLRGLVAGVTSLALFGGTVVMASLGDRTALEVACLTGAVLAAAASAWCRQVAGRASSAVP